MVQQPNLLIKVSAIFFLIFCLLAIALTSGLAEGIYHCVETTPAYQNENGQLMWCQTLTPTPTNQVVIGVTFPSTSTPPPTNTPRPTETTTPTLRPSNRATSTTVSLPDFVTPVGTDDPRYTATLVDLFKTATAVAPTSTAGAFIPTQDSFRQTSDGRFVQDYIAANTVRVYTEEKDPVSPDDPPRTFLRFIFEGETVTFFVDGVRPVGNCVHYEIAGYGGWVLFSCNGVNGVSNFIPV